MVNGKRILGIIPARLESSRLHQKTLHKIFDIPLVEHVYRRAIICTILDDLIVATDSQIVVDLVESIGGKAILTSVEHRNPTERMVEVMEKLPPFDYYTLINGDEILLNPASIEVCIQALFDSTADASILAVPFDRENSPSDFKIVLNHKNHVMYISRNDIPSAAKNPVKNRLKAYHLMTFTPQILKRYSEMDKSPLEKIEDHEHLRLIENGYSIVAKIVNDNCISLDTPEDLPIIESLLKDDIHYKSYATP
jgi:3-deoxy-D-manno-octulosonate cytidylyltransferase